MIHSKSNFFSSCGHLTIVLLSCIINPALVKDTEWNWIPDSMLHYNTNVVVLKKTAGINLRTDERWTLSRETMSCYGEDDTEMSGWTSDWLDVMSTRPTLFYNNLISVELESPLCPLVDTLGPKPVWTERTFVNWLHWAPGHKWDWNRSTWCLWTGTEKVAEAEEPPPERSTVTPSRRCCGQCCGWWCIFLFT